MNLALNKDNDIVMSLSNIGKNYGQNTALHPIDFELKRGEVHVLFGENGAGKSTLISLIAGANKPSSGQINYDGKNVAFSSVKEARLLGICAVFQEFSLVPQLTVADNMFLGNELSSGYMLDKAAMNNKANAVLNELEFDLTADQIVGELPRAGQQMVEIAKAFCANVSVLILDEPTASLTEHETAQLFRLVNKLKSQGVGIIYITHRMAEIRQISDRVTVLRDGHLIGRLNTRDLDENSLVEMMTGGSASDVFPHVESTAGNIMFEVTNLSSNLGINDISLHVKQGEIVGLAGLIGSGKSEFAQVCYGLAPKTHGQIKVCAKDISAASPSVLIEAGLYYCSPDRHDSGLVLDASIGHNLTLSALKTAEFSFDYSYVLKTNNERQRINTLMQRLRIKADDSHHLVNSLSGGNQQKVMLAKALSRQFEVFIFDEPTVGVDVATRKIIYQFIAELCQQGAAILLISSDLPEIIHLTHRAYVFCEGQIAVHLEQEHITEQKVLSHFFAKGEAA